MAVGTGDYEGQHGLVVTSRTLPGHEPGECDSLSERPRRQHGSASYASLTIRGCLDSAVHLGDWLAAVGLNLADEAYDRNKR